MIRQRPDMRPETQILGGSSKVLTDAKTSARLSLIRKTGTAPELRAGTLLRQAGFKYTKNNKSLPGSPDFANRRRKWAVFVHGCFWHSHADCVKATIPKRNSTFWLSKFQRNRQRDAAAITELKSLGFRVSVLWECQLKTSPQTVKRKLQRLKRLLGT